MQSKISPLATLVAVVAFAAAPAFAVDAHFVPVPTGGVVADAEDVAGDALPDAADAPPEAAALPSDIPWPELNGFPRPLPGAGEAGEAGDATAAGTDTTASTWSTWCPDPTVFTWGSATYSVSTATWVTLTDCPLSSSSASSTETAAPVIPHPRPHPHPGPGPEEHEGHSPEITSLAPIKPPSHTVAPIIPTHSPVVVAGASKTQGFLLGVAAAALGLAVFGL